MTALSVPMTPLSSLSVKSWTRHRSAFQHFVPHFVAHFVEKVVLSDKVEDKVEDKVRDKVGDKDSCDQSISEFMRPAQFRFPWTMRLLLIAWLGILSCTANAQTLSSSSSEKAGEDLWSFNIVPYLWVAGYEGTVGPTGVASVPQVHSTSADPYATHISAGAMLMARVRYRDVGLMLDGAWVRLTTEATSDSSLYSGTEMKTDFAYGTIALSYRLPTVGTLQSDVFAGARTWHIGNQLDFQSGSAPAFTSSSSRNWTDPILGAQLRYDLTRHWFGTMLGDIGGFGVGSEISWSVFGGVGYQFTDWLSATVGYRYMHVDYDKDQFLMNVNVQGFLVGLGFRF
jgi:opacity protein-like surface antigen